MTPTPEQETILLHQLNKGGHLMIEALPGTGKTSTLVMLAKKTPPELTLSLAFNKKIAEEMKLRFPGHFECSTLNSLGHKAWGKWLGRKLTLDRKKSYDNLKVEVEQLQGREKEDAWEGFADLLKACDKARLLGWIPDSHFPTAHRLLSNEECFQVLDYESLEGFPPLFQALLINTTVRNINQAFQGIIDFNDQVYMPTLFGGSFQRFPRVFVDEVQDLSLLNHRMITQVVQTQGTLVAVGDKWQSIYAFRGAATDSMARLKEQFQMASLPLSVCFRCPKSVIRRAQFRAPNMHWPDGAPEGEVRELEDWDAESIAQNSAIICRNNAPLFAAALYLLRNKRGVRMAKSDIGASLIKLLKKIGANTSTREGLLSAINSWRLDKLSKVSEDKAGIIQDRADCLKVFAKEGSDLTSAIAYAEHLFSSTGTVDLLSGHAAKGLEYDTVYHLDSWRIPSKWARKAREAGNQAPFEQELNLRFIITTRAKQALYFINSKEREEEDA